MIIFTDVSELETHIQQGLLPEKLRLYNSSQIDSVVLLSDEEKDLLNQQGLGVELIADNCAIIWS